MKRIHEFDNGVKVFDEHLLEIQRQRYQIRNVHEQDEEDIFISLIRDLPSQAVFVNVGTAIGYYPLLARALRDDLSIHCFEPLPSHLSQFRDNIVLNGLREEDFYISPAAISVESGTVKFVDNSFGSSLSKCALSANKQKKMSFRSLRNQIKHLLGNPTTDKEITVTALKLSDVFQEIKSHHIDLLQMDIQGYELPVLDTYFAQRKPGGGTITNFLVGTHGDNIHRKCKELLENGGYTILQDEKDSPHQPDGILVGTLKSHD